MTTTSPKRPVLVDLAALQSPNTRGRGIGRYALQWARALEQARPDLVDAYLFHPTWTPPGAMELLGLTKKVRDVTEEDFEGVRVLHALSPLDGAIAVQDLFPRLAAQHRLAISATVYDLIPALDLANELIEPIDRLRYRTRLEFVRHADSLQVLSDDVASDVARLLAPAGAIHVIGGAAAETFTPARSPIEARARAAALVAMPNLAYVLYPSGHHPRKNNEMLIAAWAQLPRELRTSTRLVIAGAFPESTRHHFVELATTLGVKGAVIVPGEVDDATMLALYQGADLVCFASLAEGYGLPIVEAQACNIPVICADRAAHNQLVPSFARFDATDASATAAILAKALTDSHYRARLTRASEQAEHHWSDVAQRSASAFDELLSLAQRPTSQRSAARPRLAFVTPLPPAATGIAAYNYRLIEELVALDLADIDVFCEGDPRTCVAPAGTALHRVAALPAIERLRGAYDEVIYAFGNSHHHLGALAMLRQRPGIVISHDVRLANLYRHEHGDPGLLRGGFARALRSMYGDDLPENLGQEGLLSQSESEHFAIFMAREIIGLARRFLVSSEAAGELARIDAQPEHRARIATLPFAVEAPRSAGRLFVESRPTVGDGADETELDDHDPRGLKGPVIAHFGIVDPSKAPELLIASFGLVHEHLPEAWLAFVGPISGELAAALRAQVADLAIAPRLILTGAVPVDRYRAWLEHATLAVQLRKTFNGEASAAVGECLSCGVATIVSRFGWFDELPDDVVHKVDRDVTVNALASSIEELVGDAAAREALGKKARAYAAEHGFDVTARALAAEVALVHA